MDALHLVEELVTREARGSAKLPHIFCDTRAAYESEEEFQAFIASMCEAATERGFYARIVASYICDDGDLWDVAIHLDRLLA